ncbi:hypothetical protein [uncultured Roseibium sp.]|uniref:hypothetical protein n=1 Tax=uncultured Roseibium sp. TaxID=1936171 RepID=UPI002633CE84|nr:hypothetical protein [uncultured Roseibium sp.]
MYFVVAPLLGVSFQLILTSISCTFGVLIFMIFMWASGRIGGGAAKLVAALSLWLGFSAPLFKFLLILTLIIAGWWIGVALSQRMLSRPVSWELPFVPIIIPVFVYTFMQSELDHLITSSLQGIKA